MIKGRIIKGVGGLYTIAAHGGIYECGARGKFRHTRITPTVGDYVEISLTDEDSGKGIIENILDRKNLLIRPRVANVDVAVVQFAAASPDINFDLLDRFLILADTQGIDNIIICINKCDLMSEATREYMQRVYGGSYELVFTSAVGNIGTDELRERLNGHITVFAGPSGVGKSSVINALMQSTERKTGEISKKIKRGKHTTREVELLELNEDTFIVDSPGFTSLRLDFLDAAELQNCFREFRPYLTGCYFNDCRHISEPDCTLRAHIGEEVSRERYDRFVKLYNELLQSQQYNKRR